MSKLTLPALRQLCEQKRREIEQRTTADTGVQITVGMGTCGIAAGAKETMRALTDALSAQPLPHVTLRQAGCMGLCHSEPTVQVSVPGMPTVIYGLVQPALAAQIVAEHVVGRQQLPGACICPTPTRDDQQVRIVLRNCGIIDPENIDEYIARDGYAALAKSLSELTPETVLRELEKSGLRGRGGAGYPTARKWLFTRQAQADQKYIVCNADEGDPGAYMDRSTLEGDPHSVLEAMLIAGYTVGADKGYIYIRAEYPLAITLLENALQQARAYGLLGQQILGSAFSFDIELRLGAGAFVCGEETALLASVEGRRGMPIPRPPFPAVRGLWNKPTVINNVETLANIPVIIMRGGDWFSRIGTGTSKGTKVFALTGKVNRSGLIEVPMGTTLRQIIFEIGGGIRTGHTFKAAQTGGPSGGVIPPEFLDTPIDYETLSKIGSIMGSGGLIVMDDSDCMVDVAKFYLAFSVEESCGKCAPCRIGGRTLFDYLEKIAAGKASLEDLTRMRAVCQAMQRAALCGLGQTAPNPVLSTMRYFADEYQEHIEGRKCRAGKCRKLLRYRIDAVKCVGCTACARVCPAGAITGERKKAHTIVADKCVQCGECFHVCKFKAVARE
ncbi:MAG: NADH-quinone oxidoreductase subunit NuoF [bacterium]